MPAIPVTVGAAGACHVAALLEVAVGMYPTDGVPLTLTPLIAFTTVAAWVPVTCPDKEPLKLVAVVAVVALPANAAVIMPAAKLPDPSRFTIVLAVLVLTAAFAALAPLATLAAATPPTNDTTVALSGPVTSPAKVTLATGAIVGLSTAAKE